MIRRLGVFFSIFLLLFSVPVYAYELPSEFSFLASPSNADIMPIASYNFDNSVIDRKSIQFNFYDSFSNYTGLGVRYPSDSGYLSWSSNSVCNLIDIRFRKGIMPPVGKYDLTITYRSDLGGYTPSVRAFIIYNSTLNANTIQTSFNSGFNFTTVSGDWMFHTVIDLKDVSSFCLSLTPGNIKQFGGYIYVSWVKVDSSTDSNIAFPSYTSSDQAIENSLGNIDSGIGDLNSGIGDVSSGIDELNGTLNMTNESIGGISSSVNVIKGQIDDLIRTISLQLEALWNQLYNIMHKEQLANDDKNTQDIIDAIDDVEVSVNVNNEKLIANDNRLAESKEAADQERHEDTLHGFNISQDTADQESAASEIESYEDMEDQIIDSVSSTLESFELESPDTVITGELAGAFIQVSNWFQLLFDSSGTFQVILIIGLSLGVALIIIGYYRIQSGG